MPNGAALALLQALYGAHWKLKWEIEPSTAWRDLTLLLLGKARLAEAHEVASHVTDVYVLIAMRADRRFDAVIAANQPQFDIEAASEREFHALQAAADSCTKTTMKRDLGSWISEQRHWNASVVGMRRSRN
jgi:hypothetical protein